MNTRFELVRIGGVPVYLDMMFLLVLILFGYPYFTKGDTQLVSSGFVIIIGILLSLLLHELAHAAVARMCGVRTSEIELTGLGGVARFANALPRSVLIKTAIYLAGPAANLLLWLGLEQAAVAVLGSGRFMLTSTLGTLAFANYWLMLFNLLPAFPLDGGRTLEAWLGALFGASWGVRIVAVLGLLVALVCVYWAFQGNLWMLLLALVLAQVNWAALESVGGLTGFR